MQPAYGQSREVLLLSVTMNWIFAVGPRHLVKSLSKSAVQKRERLKAPGYQVIMAH
jgi:hypothetical protein